VVEVIEDVQVGGIADLDLAAVAGAGDARQVKTDEGVVFRLPDGEYRLLTTGDATGGAYGAWETTNAAGSGPPPHVHHDTDEAFYVLEGTYEFTLAGGAPVRLGPGSFINLPRGRAHAFRCLGPGHGRVLALAFPAGFERFLIAVAPPAGTVPDIERLEAIARTFGVELVDTLDAPGDPNR
jgi:quercetin dioxygenase-like cupin family protein